MNTYKVTGMTCQHCVSAVSTEVSKINGVTDVSIDLVPGGASTVTVTGNASDEQVAEAIDEAGYALARPTDLPLL
ncbi:MAG: heavy-metal-associated domain-containing protein [Aeromicrobium sp.]